MILLVLSLPVEFFLAFVADGDGELFFSFDVGHGLGIFGLEDRAFDVVDAELGIGHLVGHLRFIHV